jgi:hypothetical protein
MSQVKGTNSYFYVSLEYGQTIEFKTNTDDHNQPSSFIISGTLKAVT